MNIIDKVIAAVTPLESDQERREARERARLLAAQDGWLEQVLSHHERIEQAFEQVVQASQPELRRAALKQLALLLTGHSLAEEAVLYPALAANDEKASSEASYVEQSAAKVQIAALDDMDPMSEDFLDKLEHVRGAVAHHVYEEENSRYPDLSRKIDMRKNEMLSERYREESERYFGGSSSASGTKSGVGADGAGRERRETTRVAMPLDTSLSGSAVTAQADAEGVENRGGPGSISSGASEDLLSGTSNRTDGAEPAQRSPFVS